GARVVDTVAPLQSAGPGAVSFLAQPAHRRHLAGTRAGAVILAAADADACPAVALVSGNPYATYARVAQLLYPAPRAARGIHPSAVVGADCVLGAEVSVGPHAVLEAGCRLADGVEVGPGCVVGAGVEIGAGTRLVANVVLGAGVRLGARVLVQPGAVIGADGFGFANEAGRWVKIPQLGAVVIGDDVEVGANTTIDRGALEDTVIADGVKLDDQIMVAHNVRIGRDSALAGCVGIAGSAVIGERCTVGGGVGITGHIELADDVHVTGMSFVSHAVAQPGVYSSGMPLMENRTWRKNMARLKQLDELARRLAALERKLK
ncbi:MAG TPA: UDP-3-O-(3-hydroxymyristoyl)glucosamine N-acyltransferase, partial [Gammaproteobacteria bacterium]